jgi:hypothetical protein
MGKHFPDLTRMLHTGWATLKDVTNSIPLEAPKQRIERGIVQQVLADRARESSSPRNPTSSAPMGWASRWDKQRRSIQSRSAKVLPGRVVF